MKESQRDLFMPKRFIWFPLIDHFFPKESVDLAEIVEKTGKNYNIFNGMSEDFILSLQDFTTRRSN